MTRNAIADASTSSASRKRLRKLKAREIKKQLDIQRLQDIVDGNKGRRLEFIYEPLKIVSFERRCNVCLEPSAEFVELMSLDPEYKRYLCLKCKNKLTNK